VKILHLLYSTCTYIGWNSTTNHVNIALLLSDFAYTFQVTASYDVNWFTSMARFIWTSKHQLKEQCHHKKKCCCGLKDFIFIRISAPKIYSMQIAIAGQYEWLSQAQYPACWLCRSVSGFLAWRSITILKQWACGLWWMKSPWNTVVTSNSAVLC
jgi:hypothetical protein